MVDTALLIAGALCAAMYFTAQTADEIELRETVDALYHRIDWRWGHGGGVRFGVSIGVPFYGLGYYSNPYYSYPAYAYPGSAMAPSGAYAEQGVCSSRPSAGTSPAARLVLLCRFQCLLPLCQGVSRWLAARSFAAAALIVADAVRLHDYPHRSKHC